LPYLLAILIFTIAEVYLENLASSYPPHSKLIEAGENNASSSFKVIFLLKFQEDNF
jgi:hypothetical protein